MYGNFDNDSTELAKLLEHFPLHDASTSKGKHIDLWFNGSSLDYVIMQQNGRYILRSNCCQLNKKF
jgi:hypothetical protein